MFFWYLLRCASIFFKFLFGKKILPDISAHGESDKNQVSPGSLGNYERT